MMCEKLENIDDRMLSIESQHKDLEEEVRQINSSGDSGPPLSAERSGQKRKHLTPIALQVCVYLY